MTDVRIEIDGLPALRQRIAEISDAVRDRIITAALLAAGAPVAAAAAGRAPFRTGRLRSNMAIGRGQRQRPSVRVGPAKRAAFYGLFIERGTAPRRTAAGAARGRLTGRPFLAPAAAEAATAATAAAAEVLREELRRV